MSRIDCFRRLTAWIIITPMLILYTANSLWGEGNDHAVSFLVSQTARIQMAHKCVNYESLETWLQKDKRHQEWKKVRSLDGCSCVYSGIAMDPKIAVEDPDAWQQQAQLAIPERDFYTVELLNARYRASFADLARFEENGSKTLEYVESVSGFERPPALELMLGEAVLGIPVADFLRATSTVSVEFTNVVRSGRSAKRLVAEGVIPRIARRQSSSRHRCTWEFDAETGYCLAFSWESVGNDAFSGEYSIEYEKPSEDIWTPVKMVTRFGKDGDVRTTHFRAWSSECTMNPRECLLSYHGFKEPEFIDPRVDTRRWIVWMNVGGLLLVLGWMLRRRLQVHGRSQKP